MNAMPVAGDAPARAASIAVSADPAVQFLLRIADTSLVHAQRLGEWCGHAPVIEEDLALSNIALDLIGQARALYSHAGRLCGQDGQALDEDQLAFLREERDYRNLTLAELPRGDFAFTMLRVLLLAAWQQQLWRGLLASSDAEVAAIAAKALKEARYHQQHAADWVVRLGDGTQESARRLRSALAQAWPYVAELFEDDDVDAAVEARGLGPRPSSLRAAWDADIGAVFAAAGLSAPAAGRFRSTARQGVHTEHMGHLLATLQHLQRSYPGGAW